MFGMEISRRGSIRSVHFGRTRFDDACRCPSTDVLKASRHETTGVDTETGRFLHQIKPLSRPQSISRVLDDTTEIGRDDVPLELCREPCHVLHIHCIHHCTYLSDDFRTSVRQLGVEAPA